MPVIDYIDGTNRDIYLHSDTIGAEVNPIDVYTEMRTLRRTDESLRKYNLFLEAKGKDAKGGGKFTERYVVELEGTRIIPYDVSHELTITGTIITDDGQEGIACFDRTPLTPTTVIDINYIPKQVEVIEINTGSGITEQDKLDIADRVMESELTNHQIDGTAGRALNDVSYTEKFIYINTESGINGDGKNSSPFNNVPDAVDFAESIGWNKLMFLSDGTLDRPLKNFTIEGIGTPIIDLNGQDIDKSEFMKVRLFGHQVGVMTAREVILLDGMTGLNGVYKESGIAGNITCADNSIVSLATIATLFITDHVHYSISLGLTNTNVKLNISKLSGAIKIQHCNHANKLVTAKIAQGHIELDATNTAGEIGIAGIPDTGIIDNSAGSTITTPGIFPGAQTITNTILDEPMVSHNIIGTLGNWIRKIMYGSK